MSEPKKKYIFLDVDGVLCKMGPNGNMGRYALSRPLLRNLSYLVKQTGSKIVVTSDWRRYPEAMRVLRRALSFKGIRIHSCTPVMEGSSRMEEIYEWLHQNGQECKFLVIDDLLIHEDQILCDPEEGLTEAQVLHAIKSLSDD